MRRRCTRSGRAGRSRAVGAGFWAVAAVASLGLAAPGPGQSGGSGESSPGASSSEAPAPPETDRLIEVIERSVERGPRAASAALALRALRDPRLRPLFAHLASSDRPDLRRHGVLGLAEVDPGGRLNVALVGEIEDPAEKAVILGDALSSDLIGVEQMRRALAWPDIDPTLELVLRSRLAREGEDAGAARVAELAASAGEDALFQRVFAELLAAQLAGEGGAGWQRAWSAVESAPGENATVATLAVALAQIVDERLTGARPFVERAAAWSEGRRDLRLRAVRAMLLVAPERGAELWLADYAEAEGLSDRIRLALTALRAAETAPASVFAAVEGDGSELVRAIGTAGSAVAAGEGIEEPLLRLAERGHGPSTAQVFALLEGLDDKVRGRALRLMVGRAIEGAADEEGAAGGFPAHAVRAAAELVRLDPAGASELIGRAAASGSEAASEALLAAALGSEPTELWAEGAEPAWPSRRSGVLASMIEARLGRSLGEREADQLAYAAVGGAGLPDPLRVQAAWLTLCQRDAHRRALSEIIRDGVAER